MRHESARSGHVREKNILIMLRAAVLLAAAIASTAAFIAPSRAPQCFAPQLAAGRAAVLPRRALPTASVTRRDEDDKRIDVLQVCPARHGPVALRATRAWPRCLRRGYGGRKGSPESIPTRRACEGARAVGPGLLSVWRSLITSKSALPMQEMEDLRSAEAKRALGFLMPVLVAFSFIFYSEATTWTALDTLFFGPR